MRKKIIILTVFLLTLFFCYPITIPQEPVKWTFYDRNGEILYSEKPFFHRRASSISKQIKEGIITIEDQQFYQYHGVNFPALFRAEKQNIQSGKTVSGASTITMQLAKIFFLENQKHTYWYKIKQIFYALKLELKYSKEELLTLYLNRINLGTGSIGIHSACQRYFSKNCETLSLGELATLVGTIPNPSRFNPLTQPKNSAIRKNLVLKLWKDRKFITNEEYTFWKEQPITLKPSVDGTIHAPHFIFWVRSQVEKHINLNKYSEINVYTTIDKNIHQKALHILKSEIQKNERKNNAHNGAIIAIDHQKNEILSMIGSVDFFNKDIDGSVNITTSKRSTGSVLKPFLYGLAIKNGASPAEEIIDEKNSFAAGFGRYAPTNFHAEEEYGRVRFREALANSYNLSAVNLLQKVGVKPFLLWLNKIDLNIGTPEDLGLAAVLGAGRESLLNITTAYTIFPHEGKYQKPKFMTKVIDEQGKIIKINNLQAVDTKTYHFPLPAHAANWITHALSDNEARWKGFQRGNVLEVDRPAAVKTGTSQAFKDNWVVGYSPQITLGVWVGNARGEPLHTSSGIEGAGTIWNKVFRLLHQNLPEKKFTYHSDRKEIEICRYPYEQNSCTEKVTEFLLPKEIEKMKTSTPPVFSIMFPNNGDIFHRNTELLLKARNIPNLDDLQFYLDGKDVGNHISHLESGKHLIWAQSGEKITNKIEIVVEK